MPLTLQPKLLRALQERTLRPVGGNDELPFDVRIIAATNRDLEKCVEERTFREDLYFRLNVVRIHIPPLRARGTDALLIAQTLLERCASLSRRRVNGMTPAAADKLLSYRWPGNVRELSNCIERVVALSQSEQVTVQDLPEVIRETRAEPSSPGASVAPVDLVPLEDIERSYILRVLDAVSGNKTLAAKKLGLDRKTLYRKLRGYEVSEDPVERANGTLGEALISRH
jgi:two-component system response regulator HydG